MQKLEFQLEAKENELKKIQAEEQHRIQALEQALSSYVKITFSEARR